MMNKDKQTNWCFATGLKKTFTEDFVNINKLIAKTILYTIENITYYENFKYTNFV